MFPDGRGIGGAVLLLLIATRRPTLALARAFLFRCERNWSEMTDDTQTRCAGLPWKGWLLLLALVGFAFFAPTSARGSIVSHSTSPTTSWRGPHTCGRADFRLTLEHPPLMKLWLGGRCRDRFRIRPFRALNEKVEERDFTEAHVFYDNDAAAAQARTRP